MKIGFENICVLWGSRGLALVLCPESLQTHKCQRKFSVGTATTLKFKRNSYFDCSPSTSSLHAITNTIFSIQNISSINSVTLCNQPIVFTSLNRILNGVVKVETVHCDGILMNVKSRLGIWYSKRKGEPMSFDTKPTKKSFFFVCFKSKKLLLWSYMEPTRGHRQV